MAQAAARKLLVNRHAEHRRERPAARELRRAGARRRAARRTHCSSAAARCSRSPVAASTKTTAGRKATAAAKPQPAATAASCPSSYGNGGGLGDIGEQQRERPNATVGGVERLTAKPPFWPRRATAMVKGAVPANAVYLPSATAELVSSSPRSATASDHGELINFCSKPAPPRAGDRARAPYKENLIERP